MRPRFTTALLFSAAAAAVAACGGEGVTVDPVQAVQAESDAGTIQSDHDAGSEPDAAPPPEVDAGPFKRSVFKRHPLGGPVGNLFVDGDFELSVVPPNRTGQYGFRAFNGSGTAERNFAVETGGLCRTSLRGAVLEPDMLMLGRGTAAPDDTPHVMAIAMKAPAGLECAAVASLTAVDCDSFQSLKKLAADVPDADGWCHLSATFPGRDSSVCLFVQSKLPEGATALLDSAFLGPDDGTVSFKSGEIHVPTPSEAELFESVRRTLRRSSPLARPAPYDDLPPGP